ncbi:MAG: methylmalonyl-CoA mutase family protein [Bacteroidales bacterium]|jgi:methylmalonyl-CoA mutase|nr:methylmalonyl-CoA mutase family protein [Bacteroidales bacterium]
MADNKDRKLLSEFPPVSTEEWDAKIRTDLKGADYDRKLVWKPNEGFKVQPYYRSENLEGITYMDNLPGEFPYVRGNKKDNNTWLIRQDIDVKDFEDANKKALDVLNRGADSLGFNIDSSLEINKANIETLFNEIHLDCVEINISAAGKNLEVVNIIKEIAKDKGVAFDALSGSVNVDPIGNITIKGGLCVTVEEGFNAFAEAVKANVDLPNMRVASVNGRYFNNAGANVVQELAYSLAVGADYLAVLAEKGISVEEAAKNIRFNFAVGSSYFMEIAKFRAGRYLWSKIVTANGCEDKEAAKMNVHAETSLWNKTVYDAHVNMLRTQTEAMSASIGGVNSFTVQPYDMAFAEPTEFSERIARNQQILLKEESYFDKIADPAGGSYYIEELTQSIIKEAWSIFLEIDEKGGFLKSFIAGDIQAQIKEMAQKRDMNIARRKEIMLGTNQFPNFNEKLDEIDTDVFKPFTLDAEIKVAEPLTIYRGAQAFEEMRYKTDLLAKRPKVFMLTIGNLAMRKARAQFACNFFACAGFEVIDNNGFATVEEGVEAAKGANADIVVICSSDDEYAEYAPAALDLLKDQAILVVAGAPACAEELKNNGIGNFINVKTNVLEELKRYQSLLEI